MIVRILEKKARELLEKYPILTITGPRQSGKTTLIKKIADELPYINLEQPDIRSLATSDPKSFINNYKDGAILDEIQNVPDLFSYLQVISDANPDSKFILSGSQNFQLLEGISQSLAGRTALLKLLPFSVPEIKNGYKEMGTVWEMIYKGFYPRLYEKDIAPADFYPFYIQTYIERDIRQLINVKDLSRFIVFLKICAGRCGQVINYTSIANDVGISPNTAKDWLSALEASYIIYKLQPHHKNFNKRLTKQSKLYFYDTGLACSLLQIENTEQLKTHYLKGGLFENFVITEFIKRYANQGKEQHLYFWQDHKGTEIDLLIDKGQDITPIEIKAGETSNASYFDNLKYWSSLAKKDNDSHVIYSGNDSLSLQNGQLWSWMDMGEIG